MDGQVIWITGLSGAGKTTVAEALGRCFGKYGLKPILLDGDILRNVFNSTDETKKIYAREERVKLSHKYALLCKILSSQGLTVIISTISMYDEIYAWNRNNLPNYSEIYLKVPLKELRRRDPKNIYKNFISGTQANVSGLDVKVDQPIGAHLVINFKSGQTPQEIADIIFKATTMEQLN
jgi:cytidine diphosphoramidate kinase